MDDPVKLCDYCGQKTKYSPVEIGLKSQNPGASYMLGKNLDVHFCSHCMSEYVWLYGSSKPPHVNLYVKIDDKMYRWSKEGGQLWYVPEPGIPGVRPNKNLQLIKVFDDPRPIITPSNIQEKVKFILTFM